MKLPFCDLMLCRCFTQGISKEWWFTQPVCLPVTQKCYRCLRVTLEKWVQPTFTFLFFILFFVQKMSNKSRYTVDLMIPLVQSSQQCTNFHLPFSVETDANLFLIRAFLLAIRKYWTNIYFYFILLIYLVSNLNRKGHFYIGYLFHARLTPYTSIAVVVYNTKKMGE